MIVILCQIFPIICSEYAPPSVCMISSATKQNGLLYAVSLPPRYTSSGKTQRGRQGEVGVYAILLDWPRSNKVQLGAVFPSAATRITMLGVPGQSLTWEKYSGGGIVVTLPLLSPALLPCQWAWVLKIENLP